MLPFTRAMFIHGSNFHEQFLKGSPKENSCEIISKFDQRFQRRRFFKDFLRISSCPDSARSPHSPEPCLWTDQNSTHKFLKGSPKEHSCEIISKSKDRFQTRRFFYEFFHVHIVQKVSPSPTPPWWPCFLTDQNFANNF